MFFFSLCLCLEFYYFDDTLPQYYKFPPGTQQYGAADCFSTRLFALSLSLVFRQVVGGRLETSFFSLFYFASPTSVVLFFYYFSYQKLFISVEARSPNWSFFFCYFSLFTTRLALSNYFLTANRKAPEIINSNFPSSSALSQYFFRDEGRRLTRIFI